MNVTASPHTLIIAIGNPLRGDDGLGWAVAQQLSHDSNPDYDIHTVHQLTPELAQFMAIVKLVVIIDATYEGEPGDLRVRPLSPPAQPAPVGTHHTTPAELAALTSALYGQCPPVIVITMTGANFNLCEHLSPLIAHRLPLLSAAVRQACSQSHC